MKSNRGITLISLIVYVIVFTIVIAIVSTISGYFKKNTDEIVISTDTSQQYIRFTTYLTEDINSINFASLNVSGNCVDIIFLDGLSHKYMYDDNKIYFILKKDEVTEKIIVLCNEITDYKFEKDQENNKLKISVTIKGITYNNNYSI